MATSRRVGGGGIVGAIVPPTKRLDPFPLMSFVANNCSFNDSGEDSAEESEYKLKAANDKRVNSILAEAKLQKESKQTHISEDDWRKALATVQNMEWMSNKNDTWKVSEPTTSKTINDPEYGSFLHPLKRAEKEEEYFSGTRKVKQTKPRKRNRSVNDSSLFDGKDISSGEACGSPPEATVPQRAKVTVPSMGLPFTPGPPPSFENNRWMQRSGSSLFDGVVTNTLVAGNVSTEEDQALALAMAESLRTYREEQMERTINIAEICTRTNLPPAPAVMNRSVEFQRPSADPPGTSWDVDDEYGKASLKADEPSKLVKKEVPCSVFAEEELKFVGIDHGGKEKSIDLEDENVNTIRRNKVFSYASTDPCTDIGSTQPLPPREKKSSACDLKSNSKHEPEKACSDLPVNSSRKQVFETPQTLQLSESSQHQFSYSKEPQNTFSETKSDMEFPNRNLTGKSFSETPAETQNVGLGKVTQTARKTNLHDGTTYTIPQKRTEFVTTNIHRNDVADFYKNGHGHTHLEEKNVPRNCEKQNLSGVPKPSAPVKAPTPEVRPSASAKQGFFVPTESPSRHISKSENLETDLEIQRPEALSSSSGGDKPTRLPTSMPYFLTASMMSRKTSDRKSAYPTNGNAATLANERPPANWREENSSLKDEASIKANPTSHEINFGNHLQHPVNNQSFNEENSSVRGFDAPEGLRKAAQTLQQGAEPSTNQANSVPMSVGVHMQDSSQTNDSSTLPPSDAASVFLQGLPFESLTVPNSQLLPDVASQMASHVAQMQSYYQMLLLQQSVGGTQGFPQPEACDPLTSTFGMMGQIPGNSGVPSNPGLPGQLPSGQLPQLPGNNSGPPNPGLPCQLPFGQLPQFSGNSGGPSNPGLPSQLPFVQLPQLPGNNVGPSIPGLPGQLPFGQLPPLLGNSGGLLNLGLPGQLPFGHFSQLPGHNIMPGQLPHNNNLSAGISALPLSGQVPPVAGKGRGRLSRQTPSAMCLGGF